MKKLQVIILFVFLAGCSSSQPISPTTIPNVLRTSSPLPSETIQLPTQTLTPTSTSFPIFTSPLLLTPFPTFSLSDGVEKLRIWIQGTSECLLPCWGGIIPGSTSWQEARQILEQMSGISTVNVSEAMNCNFGACNGIAWSLYPHTVAEGVFYTKFPENIVHLIHINIQNEGDSQKLNLLRNIGLQEVFRLYGPPPILLFNVETDQADNRFMELILVYPERQFIIRYVKHTELIDDQLVNCGQDNQIELIILDNKEQLMSLSAISSAVETMDLRIDARYKSVEEATGMTPNSFYAAFSNSGSACISTPVNAWLP